MLEMTCANCKHFRPCCSCQMGDCPFNNSIKDKDKELCSHWSWVCRDENKNDNDNEHKEILKEASK